jgi:Tfp pilus assembly ATPase PilU
MKIKYLNIGRTSVMMICATRCAMHFFNDHSYSAVAYFSGSHSWLSLVTCILHNIVINNQTLPKLVHFYPEDGGNIFFLNIGINLPEYTV